MSSEDNEEEGIILFHLVLLLVVFFLSLNKSLTIDYVDNAQVPSTVLDIDQ